MIDLKGLKDNLDFFKVWGDDGDSLKREGMRLKNFTQNIKQLQMKKCSRFKR